MGFIDFGIVGRVTPVTWTALEALLTATATRDYETMARALATVGATDTDVDVKVLPALCMGGLWAGCLILTHLARPTPHSASVLGLPVSLWQGDHCTGYCSHDGIMGTQSGMNLLQTWAPWL